MSRIQLLAAVVLGGSSVMAAAQCVADLDRNGSIDAADLKIFQDSFVQGERAADLTGDGRIDVLDVIAFQSSLLDGCHDGDIQPRTDFGTLYLGIGGHWQNGWTTGLDFGSSDLSYRWLTQGDLKIRPARRYPGSGHSLAGTGGHLAYALVTNSDPSNWTLRYGTLSDEEALAAWTNAALAEIANSFADDPLNGNRKIQLDNETLHFLGWYWGRMMQAKDYLAHQRYDTVQEIDAHSAIFMPYGIAFMDALQAAYPTDEFAWYHLPVRRNWVRSAPFDNDGYFGTPPAPNNGQYPYWGVDVELIDLLAESDYIDGSVYTGSSLHYDPPLWTPYWEGQLARLKAIADDLQKPFMGRIWLQDDSDDSLLKSYDYVRDFFAACVEVGVTEAACDMGRHDFECASVMAGMDYGLRWRTLIVNAAVEAGYLDGPATDLWAVSVTPSASPPATSQQVRIEGDGFTNGTAVSVSGSGITVSNLTLSGGALLLDLAIAQSAPPGPRNITLSNGLSSFILENGFVVVSPQGAFPAPEMLVCVRPDQGERDSTYDVRIPGRHFQDGATVSFGSGITVDSVQFVSSKMLIAIVSVGANAAIGDRTVTVVNPDNSADALIDIFEVVE